MSKDTSKRKRLTFPQLGLSLCLIEQKQSNFSSLGEFLVFNALENIMCPFKFEEKEITEEQRQNNNFRKDTIANYVMKFGENNLANFKR